VAVAEAAGSDASSGRRSAIQVVAVAGLVAFEDAAQRGAIVT